jgi:hypothetical protein
MPSRPREHRFSAERRRSLQLLASSRDGVKAELLVHIHGFKRQVLAGSSGASLRQQSARWRWPAARRSRWCGLGSRSRGGGRSAPARAFDEKVESLIMDSHDGANRIQDPHWCKGDQL